MIYVTRCIAVDQQDDVTPGDKFVGQPLLCRVMHSGAAVQSDNGGKRARAVGLGQIAVYAVASDKPAGYKPLRGAFKLDALQRSSESIDHQST